MLDVNIVDRYLAMAIPEETSTVCNGTHTEESVEQPAKVRVKFVESRCVPHSAHAPPSPDVTLDFDAMAAADPADPFRNEYHISGQESGVDNPFRPDSELSREADIIVSLIKEGKPLKGQPDATDANAMDVEDSVCHNGRAANDVAVKASAGSNGSVKPKTSAPPGLVEVQHGVIVPPTDAPAVEQVVIKKKNKCQCCVVQ